MILLIFHLKTEKMRKFRAIIPLIVAMLCIASCSIDRQNKLIGYWKRVPFTNPDSSTISYWTFYAGDVLEVYNVSVAGDTSDTTVYIYSTKGKELSILPDNDGAISSASGDICGKFWLDELKKRKTIKMTRIEVAGKKSGAYMRIELVKQ